VSSRTERAAGSPARAGCLIFWAVGKRNLARGIVGDADLLAAASPTKAPTDGATLEPLGVTE
jgi:hypothetical protein